MLKYQTTTNRNFSYKLKCKPVAKSLSFTEAFRYVTAKNCFLKILFVKLLYFEQLSANQILGPCFLCHDIYKKMVAYLYSMAEQKNETGGERPKGLATPDCVCSPQRLRVSACGHAHNSQTAYS